MVIQARIKSRDTIRIPLVDFSQDDAAGSIVHAHDVVRTFETWIGRQKPFRPVNTTLSIPAPLVTAWAFPATCLLREA